MWSERGFLDSVSRELDVKPRVDHASIHVLPTELLVRVFYFATEFRYSNLTLRAATKILLSLCRVSRYWRAVTLSIPKIWGRLINIIDFSEDQVLRFIERSKSSPIELFLDGEQSSINSTNTQARLSRVLLELNRISYLVIRRFHLSASHFDLLCHPAPSLDLFSFEGCGLDPVRLPALFGNNAPRLRSLRLSSALVDFGQVLFPYLRELHIRNIRDPFPPPSSTWLTFLSKHTCLTSLNLSYAVSVRFSDAYEWLPNVHLSQLRELTLSDDATSCARFLAKITMPNNCKISVITGLDSHQGVRLLQASISALATPRISKHLQVAFTGISVAFTSMIDKSGFSDAENSLFFFKFQWETKFDPFEDMRLLHNPLDFLPTTLLSSIETLRLVLLPIDGRYPLQDDSLRSELGEWLRNLTLVEHLVVDSCQLDALLDLLSDDYDILDANESEGLQLPPVFPSLRGLEVVRTEEEELDWEAVTSFSEWRNDVGQRISNIVVSEEEIFHLNEQDGAILADLDIEIILR